MANKTVKKGERPQDYVNNKDLYIAIKAYQEIFNADYIKIYNEAEWIYRHHLGESFYFIEREINKFTLKYFVRPKIPDEIGAMFMKMVENYAKKPNFSGYPFIEEMKSDALMVMCRYINTFDPEKSRNPFAYFTMSIHRAFIGRINSEKRMLSTKNNLFDIEVMNGRTFENHSILNDMRRDN